MNNNIFGLQPTRDVVVSLTSGDGQFCHRFEFRDILFRNTVLIN
jgi:hypothetical protein